MKRKASKERKARGAQQRAGRHALKKIIAAHEQQNHANRKSIRAEHAAHFYGWITNMIPQHLAAAIYRANQERVAEQLATVQARSKLKAQRRRKYGRANIDGAV